MFFARVPSDKVGSSQAGGVIWGSASLGRRAGVSAARVDETLTTCWSSVPRPVGKSLAAGGEEVASDLRFTERERESSSDSLACRSRDLVVDDRP